MHTLAVSNADLRLLFVGAFLNLCLASVCLDLCLRLKHPVYAGFSIAQPSILPSDTTQSRETLSKHGSENLHVPERWLRSLSVYLKETGLQ